MKHGYKKAIATLLLLASAIGTLSCGKAQTDDPKKPEGTDPAVTGEASDTQADENAYPYGTEDLENFTFRIGNIDEIWDMLVAIDVESTNSEPVNDAIYTRNRLLESEFNCKIEVTKIKSDPTELNQSIYRTIMSGEDAYDVTYAAIHNTPALLSDECFLDLYEMDELHLKEEWWDQNVIRQATFKNQLYFASSPMQLMVLDSAWGLFFNETMMGSLDLELPYDMVREGKWTLDVFYDYCKTAANLNGGTSFTEWDNMGSTVWGMSSHTQAPEKFLVGCEEFMVETNEEGDFINALGDERFVEVMASLSPLLDVKTGNTIRGNDEGMNAENGGYVYVFHSGRSLFCTAEIKSAQKLRDFKDSYGILPFPKYDETQEDYLSTFCNQAVFFTIPVTNTRLHETALLSDALSYYSNRDVLPEYYGKMVEQKGLRNQDSIDMLDIIRAGNTIDQSILFALGNNFLGAFRTAMFAGKTEFGSMITTYGKQIDANIEKVMEAFE